MKILECPVCGKKTMNIFEVVTPFGYKMIRGYQHACGAYIKLNILKWTLYGMVSMILTVRIVSLIKNAVDFKLPDFVFLVPVGIVCFTLMSRIFSKYNMKVIDEVKKD